MSANNLRGNGASGARERPHRVDVWGGMLDFLEDRVQEMTESNVKSASGANGAHQEKREPFDLDHDIDQRFKNEQKAIDDLTPAEYQEVLRKLDEASANFKELIPDFVCHLTRLSEESSTFVYKNTNTTLSLVKEHLAERGRDYALQLTMPGGKKNNYRPYTHEEGLVWICDDKSGEDLVGTSKDFAAKIVEKCSRG